MCKANQVEALENGKGIQYLLDSAYIILDNPISAIDINYNLLAYTDITFEDPNWNELTTTGTYSLETMEFLANEGLIEDITNAEKTVVLRNEKLKYAKMAGHFYNRDNIEVGLIMASEYGAPFNAESEEAFEALADKITGEIRDYDYFTMLGITFHEDKINMLLDGAVKNPLLYNPQAQILYNGFEDYLYVAVVGLPRKSLLERVHISRLAYFQSLLKTKYQSFKFSVYGDYIVMLMSSKRRHFYGPQLFAAHAGLFGQNGLAMGISDSFENIYELRKYYDQAVDALTKGLKGGDGRRVFLHE